MEYRFQAIEGVVNRGGVNKTRPHTSKMPISLVAMPVMKFMLKVGCLYSALTLMIVFVVKFAV